MGSLWHCKNADECLVSLYTEVSLDLYRREMKEGQLSICVTPGFCLTDMTKHMASNPLSYSSLSGATRIYQTALREDAKS